jgi:anti-sigma factor (TIGR02949 family)
MNCHQALEHLYEYLDRELTPDDERQVREHLTACSPCGDRFDVEQAFLQFIEARCRAQGAPPELRRRILRDLLDA